MTTQIAVRLPDEIVAYVDTVVGEGASSRAAVVAQALRAHQQQRLAEADAKILEQSGDYDDFEGLASHQSIEG